jgi:signal transduction histidine kinase
MRRPQPRTDSERAAERLELAHALRTPLTSLALGLDLLEHGVLGPITEPQREVLRSLVAGVQQLSLIVDRTLQTDRLGAHAGPVDRIPTRLHELVERATAPLLPQARARRIKVMRSLLPGIIAVVDPVKLSWVIASVLGNALRFSPNGGRVEVVLAAAGGEAMISIRDRGPGVSPEIRDRLFERTGGPGLFLAREIVEAHGGSISVTSEPGSGSSFTITLPLSGGVA